MMKRIFVGIFIGIVIIGVSVYYYLNRPEPVVDSVYRAVPLDAAFLMDLKDYNSFQENLEQNRIWTELAYFPLFKDVDRKIKFADSLLTFNPGISALLGDKKSFLISGHPAGKENIQLVYYFKIGEKRDFNKIDKLIRSYRNNLPEISSRSYENATIYDVSFPVNAKENFSYTWSHGLVILSTSSILIEDAVRQLSAQESLLSRKDLTEIIKTSGKNSPANLYFNIKYFPQLAQKFIHNRYRKDLTFLTDLGSWMELDINVKPDVIMLNGFSIDESGKTGLIPLFRGQKPLQLHIFGKIPGTSGTFLILGIDKYQDYRMQYGKMESPVQKGILQEMKEKYEIDLIRSFADIFDQEAAIAFAGDSNDSTGRGAWTILRTKSAEDANNFLNNLLSQYSVVNGTDLISFMTRMKIDGKETQIWNLPFLDIPTLLFGKIFSANQGQYCTISDNYLIFAESQEKLISYLLLMKKDATIAEDLEFNKFSDYFSSKSNFFFYTRPVMSLDLYSGFFKENIMADLSAQNAHVRKIGSIVYQFNINDQNLIYHNFFVRYSNGITASVQPPKPELTKPDTDSKPETTKENTESKIVLKPLLIKNPVTKETEVLIADSRNQISLVSKQGQTIWKMKLSEPVLSDIFLIDYYKNGKLQFLFNTPTKMYLIDRNGKNVEKFPVTLPETATNGLSVFDYEKNRDYRIMIAADKNIYAFNKSGEIINQWKPDETREKVTQPVQFFRIAAKDYLIYHDSRDFYAVNRKGQKIISLTNLETSEGNSFFLINPENTGKARFVCSGKKGNIFSIGTDGKLTSLNIARIPQVHWFDVFDIDGDHSDDYVFSWDKRIVAYSQKNKKILDITTPARLSFRPQFFKTKGKCMIGVVSEGEIYFYNNKGQTLKGFPLKGNSQFLVDGLENKGNKLYLVIGNNNNLLYHDFVL